MSRFSGLTKSAIWVAAGLIIGAGAGAGIGFLIVSLNEQNANYSYGKPQSDLLRNTSLPIDIKEHETGDAERQSIFGNFIDRSNVKETQKGVYETASSNETDINVVDLGLKVLSYKLQHRLGFGPEVSILKNITISPEGAWDEANGVFLGSSNQIFINSSNIISMFRQVKSMLGSFNSKEEEIEYIAEFVFQIIAHEYNHHMAYIYLNSRSNELKTQHQMFNKPATYVDVKGSVPNLKEAWDTDFYNSFVKALNYDDNDLVKSNAYLHSYANGDFNQSYKDVGVGKGNFKKEGDSYIQVEDGKGSYVKNEPISKYFTAADIFKYANNNNVKNISHGSTVWDDNKVYSFYKYDQPATYYTQEELAYHYSLAELYARKVQQMTMPTSIDYSDTLDENGKVVETYPLPKFRNLKIFPQWLPSSSDPKVGRIVSRFYKEVDKNNVPIWRDNNGRPLFSFQMIGYDQLIWSSSGRGSYSPFLLDTKNYADDIYSIPFTSDYLYEQEASGSYNSANAYAIYDAILQEMGYSGENVKNNFGATDKTMQSDISEVWWENKGEADKKGNVIVAEETNQFKMGGYINNPDYQYVGYMDSNNNFVKYDISVNAFTYAVKKEGLNDARDASYNDQKDRYFWTLNDYQNINNFKDKPLFFGIDKSTLISKLESELIALEGRIANEKDPDIKTQLEEKRAAKTKKINDIKATTNEILAYPMTSYNSEATTWLSLDSVSPRSGINTHIAYPTYDSKTLSVILEVE